MGIASSPKCCKEILKLSTSQKVLIKEKAWGSQWLINLLSKLMAMCLLKALVDEGIYFTLLKLVQADLALIEAPQMQIFTDYLAIQCR